MSKVTIFNVVIGDGRRYRVLKSLNKFFNKMKFKLKYCLMPKKKRPWAVIYDDSTKKEKVKYKEESAKFYDYASRIIKPNRKPITDLQKYLIGTYHAVECVPKDVIYNLFMKKLYDYLYPSDKPRGDLLDEMLESCGGNPFTLTPEELTKMENIETKPIFYKIRRDAYTASSRNDDIIIGMDLVSEYIDVSNASEEILFDLMTYLGVTKEAIETRSLSFMSYASLLRLSGKIEY